MTDLLIDELIDMALREDVGSGDRTTEALIAPDMTGTARVVARRQTVVAGTEAFVRVFSMLAPGDIQSRAAEDGTVVREGEELARISGPCRALLTGERTALNFLQRLSGIATLTRKFVDSIERYPAVLLDTRKTTPGWRVLEKQAVRAGGGCNHRMGLFDAVLIKENHIAACGGVGAALERARACTGPHITVEVEVRNQGEFREALAAEPDMILLDNMSEEDIRNAVAEARGKIPLEASGTVTLDTIEALAATGVDYISVGALTHSAPAADISMITEPVLTKRAGVR